MIIQLISQQQGTNECKRHMKSLARYILIFFVKRLIGWVVCKMAYKEPIALCNNSKAT